MKRVVIYEMTTSVRFCLSYDSLKLDFIAFKMDNMKYDIYQIYEMTTSVRFCLSYDPLKLDFIAFKMDNISIRKRIVDTDVVNDVTSTRQSVITRVVI